jgi:RNA methyltransferase, TrmH family
MQEPWSHLVARIRSCATPKGRAVEGACSLEGTRLFERALRAGAKVQAAVTTQAFLDDGGERTQALLSELRGAGVALQVVPDAVLAELTDGRSIGALVGLAQLPGCPTLQSLAQATEAPRFLAGLGIDDPGNIGALLRTAHAAGASALLTVGACDAFHPKAVRTSMGSVFKLPVLSFENLSDLLGELRDLGISTVGTVSSGGKDWTASNPPVTGCAVFMGSEAFGLSEEEQAQLDHLVTIPMADGVDSLSVNAAAAVLMYAVRPRG